MAKVSKKSEKNTAFGGIFFILDKFDSILFSMIDFPSGTSHYSDRLSVQRDLNQHLKNVLTERPHTHVLSADAVLRGIEELATENISYTAEKTDNIYNFNTAEKLN